jgi:hypothetical protein
MTLPDPPLDDRDAENRAAIAAVFRQCHPEINVDDDVVSSVNPPHTVIWPSRKGIQRKGFGNLAAYPYEAVTYYGQTNDVAARRAAGALVGQTAPVVRALNRTRVRGGFVRVDSATVAERRYGRTRLTAAVHFLTVLA